MSLQNLARMLTENKSLFSYDNFFLNDITVVDLDFDEETSKPGESCYFTSVCLK